jgi:nicotinate-nucleotide adenylyltransferase
MARAALEQLSLEKVLWIPTGTTAYREPAQASAAQRVAMLRLALEAEPRYEIDVRELSQGASGYAADTLHELRLESGPEAALYLLLGADQFAKLGTWHRPDEVARLARFAVFPRPGVTLRDPRAEIVALPPSDVSASEIRARAGRGEDLSALVPAAVADYIAQHGLYRVRNGVSS